MGRWVGRGGGAQRKDRETWLVSLQAWPVHQGDLLSAARSQTRDLSGLLDTVTLLTADTVLHVCVSITYYTHT